MLSIPSYHLQYDKKYSIGRHSIKYLFVHTEKIEKIVAPQGEYKSDVGRMTG